MKISGAVFVQNFHEQQSDHEVFLEDLKLAELFEPLGFDAIWSVEHHFSPYTMVPDVLQFLTYLCGHTRRIGLGTMVVVLPWHDPVRVAEQISMLDIMAQGRSLTLGFGRGAGRIEFDGFRVPMSEARERFAEAAEIIKLALSQKRFSFNGKFFQIPEMSIRPQPLDKDLVNRMYGAIVSPETGDIMAKAGMGMLVIPQKPWEEHRKDYDAYQLSCERAGFKAKAPIAGCWVYCARTEREAMEAGRKWSKNYAESALNHYEYHEPEHFKAAKGYEYHAQMAQVVKAAGGFPEMFADTQVIGTPQRCIEVLRNVQNTLGASEFVGVFKYGGMPYDEAERSLRLFASEVMPAMKAEAREESHPAAAGS
jgi:alkanesulfonate monooxygenase SsuD/methylene tetrahydromethanopterin reductase-like flavin-dependent oxidoreductase (luciferase family)